MKNGNAGVPTPAHSGWYRSAASCRRPYQSGRHAPGQYRDPPPECTSGHRSSGSRSRGDGRYALPQNRCPCHKRRPRWDPQSRPSPASAGWPCRHDSRIPSDTHHTGPLPGGSLAYREYSGCSACSAHRCPECERPQRPHPQWNTMSSGPSMPPDRRNCSPPPRSAWSAFPSLHPHHRS